MQVRTFAFPHDVKQDDLIWKAAKFLDLKIEKVTPQKSVISHFLPNGDVLNDMDGRLILCSMNLTNPASPRKEMSDISKRIASTLSSLSMMRMEFNLKSLFAALSKDEYKTIFSIVEVYKPMRVVFLVIESEYDIPEIEGWIPIKEQSFTSYFNRKIALCGASSSGKTETARTLTAVMNIKHGANAEHASEYARSFILRYGVPDWRLQPFIADGQTRREQDIAGHNIIISDGPRFLNTIYAQHYFDEKLNDQNIYILNKIYKASIRSFLDYTDVVYCSRQKIKIDGCRYQTEDVNEKLDRSIYSMLKENNVDFIQHDVMIDSVEDLAKKIFCLN